MNQRLCFLLFAAVFSLCHAWNFPSNITLRGGVLHAPPFATVEEGPSGFAFGGFQVDLLQRMTIFAAKDNVTLKIEMSPSPPQFGPAFDTVANDCIMTKNNYTLEDCNKFDFIVANYYSTPERGLRAHLSPPWLRSSISAIKYLDKKGPDFTTLSQVSDARASVCLKDGTFYSGLVREKFPNATYVGCPGTEECIAALKNESCVLYVMDELGLRYAAAWDPTLQVTPEQFNTQYIVWPLSYNLPVATRMLMDKWIRDAITNATMDELYFKYFQKALCPVGTAGKDCELPCDPGR
jgi:ABC-type amino acid transport substrate-binding protein